jgi:superfamily II DNA/RNA helicase
MAERIHILRRNKDGSISGSRQAPRLVPQESITSTDTLAGTDAGAETEAVTATAELTFADLGLSPDVLRAVTDSGYTVPTPIQAQGIPEVLKGRDIIGIAQTGTGKTASFTLPMIERLARGRAKARMPRSLILEPTRELAAQVAESFERYGKHHKLSMALLIGGVSFDEQDKKIDRGVDVLIATPGRLLDHVGRGKLMMSGVQIFVIDEADRMLDMGFIPDVEKIAKMIPFTRQTLFYSATMPPEIQRLTEQFLQAPKRIEVSRPATAASTITQVMVTVPGGDWSKRESLRRILRENDVVNAIVFCNRKRDVDVVAKSLLKHGFSCAPLHGDLDQSVRTKTLEAFKGGSIQILVASDVAARGLDIPAVGHVFNYDVPFHADDYVHRIGRTGRAGRKGFAFTLVGRSDEKNVTAIEALIGQNVERRVMEGLPEEREQEGGNRRNDRRGGRGKERDRAPRGRGPRNERSERPAPRSETSDVIELSAAPVEASVPEVPVQEIAKPDSSRRDRRDRKPQSRNEQPRNEQPQRAPEPQRAAEPRNSEPRRNEQREPVRYENSQRDQTQQNALPRSFQNNRNRQQGKVQSTPVSHDQLPAFLLRPVILPPKPVKKGQREETDSGMDADAGE